MPMISTRLKTEAGRKYPITPRMGMSAMRTRMSEILRLRELVTSEATQNADEMNSDVNPTSTHTVMNKDDISALYGKRDCIYHKKYDTE